MGIIYKSDIHNYKANLYELQFPQRNIFVHGIETFASILSDISSLFKQFHAMDLPQSHQKCHRLRQPPLLLLRPQLLHLKVVLKEIS